MIKSKVETQSGKWNEFVPKCRQANKLKKAKTLFTATFLTELEFTGWRTELCNKFTCAQYDVISVCTKFRVVDNTSPSLRYQPFYVYGIYWTTYVLCSPYQYTCCCCWSYPPRIVTHYSPTPPILCQLTRKSFLDHLLCALPGRLYSYI